MKLTSLQKMIIVAALVVVVAVLVVAFVIMPQFTQLADLQTQKTAAEARASAATGVLENLRAAKGRAAATGDTAPMIGWTVSARITPGSSAAPTASGN